LNKEIVRKIIHMTSIGIPLAFMFVSRNVFMSVVFPLTFIALLIEIGRLKFRVIQRIFIKIFGNLLRPYEIQRFTGATWLFLGASFSVILFGYPVALMVLFLLTICDAVAAIVGENFGKIKLGEKTLEGSLTFFIVGIFIVIWIPQMGLTQKIIGVLIGTFLEALKTPIDDNILVPLGTGTVVELVRKISF